MGGERDCGVSVDVPGAQQRSLSRPCPVLGGRRWRRTGPGVCRGGGGGGGQWRRRYFCRSLVPRLDQGLITLSVPKLPVVWDSASTDGRQGPGDTAASGSVGPPC